MSRMSPFNHPFLVGFDQFERAVDRVSRSSSDGFPPYNIEQIGDDRLRITLAVAGFEQEELVVTVERNELVIEGRQQDGEERVYLHRGIAARSFQRRFVLADGIEVSGATLEKGLLHVDLARPKVSSGARRIDIGAGASEDAG